MNECVVDGCTHPILNKSNGWCSKHYNRWYAHGDVNYYKRIPADMPLEDRLKHVGWDVDDNDCWIWRKPAPEYSDGHVTLKYRGKRIGVHRLAWVAWRGPIPDGKQLNHHCDVPNCINPDHLYLGTQQDNIQDMVDRGRTRSARALTREQVFAILDTYATGDYTQVEVELRFGIKGGSVSRMNRGILYKDDYLAWTQLQEA